MHLLLALIVGELPANKSERNSQAGFRLHREDLYQLLKKTNRTRATSEETPDAFTNVELVVFPHDHI